jgi:hypothetical protein
MGGVEREEFLARYEIRKSRPFNNKQVLEAYGQDDVTVLRHACRVFRREFLQIGNIDVFFESLTIASACNQVFAPQVFEARHYWAHPQGRVHL